MDERALSIKECVKMWAAHGGRVLKAARKASILRHFSGVDSRRFSEYNMREAARLNGAG